MDARSLLTRSVSEVLRARRDAAELGLDEPVVFVVHVADPLDYLEIAGRSPEGGDSAMPVVVVPVPLAEALPTMGEHLRVSSGDLRRMREPGAIPVFVMAGRGCSLSLLRVGRLTDLP